MLAPKGTRKAAKTAFVPRRKQSGARPAELSSVQSLIQTYGAALEQSRLTGNPVSFTVAVEPGHRPIITPLGPPPVVENSQELSNALDAARARGRTRIAEILGGHEMMSAEQFAELIGTSRVTVNTKRRNHQVLGLDGAKRGYRFPDWQVGENGKPFEALPALFERFDGSAWAVYRFLVQHHPELDGLTGLQVLRRGQSSRAIAVAEGIARGTFA